MNFESTQVDALKYFKIRRLEWRLKYFCNSMYEIRQSCLLSPLHSCTYSGFINYIAWLVPSLDSMSFVFIIGSLLTVFLNTKLSLYFKFGCMSYDFSSIYEFQIVIWFSSCMWSFFFRIKSSFFIWLSFSICLWNSHVLTKN